MLVYPMLMVALGCGCAHKYSAEEYNALEAKLKRCEETNTLLNAEIQQTKSQFTGLRNEARKAREEKEECIRDKQAYLDNGFDAGDAELADHLAVVLEFAAIGDRLTGDALLAEHVGAIGLLHSALESMGSPYALVVEAVIATLPAITPEIADRMAAIATQGPPSEQVGLEPFTIGTEEVRR